MLRPEEFARHAKLVRLPVGDRLDRWVENHWCLSWDLPEGAHFTSQTLPHPACTVSVELGGTRAAVGEDPVVITGVVSRRFDVVATGRCWVFGIKFRPGGLAALAGLDARLLTDRTVPAADRLPAESVALLRTLTADLDPAAAVETAERALAGLVRDDPDPGYDTVLAVVAEMLGDRSLLQVAQVAARHGLSRRRLERLFAHYVGVGPKWVLARYRMHDVVSALDAGWDGSLADLAAAHGWYDQAHFNRDFGALVGTTPSRYRDLSRARPTGTTR